MVSVSKYAYFIVCILILFTACKSNKEAHKSGKYKKLAEERDALLEEVNKQKMADSSLSVLNNNVKDALPGFNEEDLKVEMRNGKIYVSMSDKLLFKTGSATVEEKGRTAIKQLAVVVNKYPEIEIMVEGHTDNVPIKNSLYKDNWDLSAARAITIVRMLSQDYKVNPQRLTAAGKGEYQPVASNQTTDGRAKNRRTEIILSPRPGMSLSSLNN